jgi:hypothetical protein
VRSAAAGIGSHHSHDFGKDEWLTPRFILDALGPFDLDPCAPVNRPWPMAREHFTVFDNGLAQVWNGRVWLNPPYGAATHVWLDRLAAHGDGIALIFARTETDAWARLVWPRASAILFLFGRLTFCHVSGQVAGGNSGAPSALIAYGQNNARVLRNCKLPGALVEGAWITGGAWG